MYLATEVSSTRLSEYEFNLGSFFTKRTIYSGEHWIFDWDSYLNADDSTEVNNSTDSVSVLTGFETVVKSLHKAEYTCFSPES